MMGHTLACCALSSGPSFNRRSCRLQPWLNPSAHTWNAYACNDTCHDTAPACTHKQHARTHTSFITAMCLTTHTITHFHAAACSSELRGEVWALLCDLLRPPLPATTACTANAAALPAGVLPVVPPPAVLLESVTHGEDVATGVRLVVGELLQVRHCLLYFYSIIMCRPFVVITAVSQCVVHLAPVWVQWQHTIWLVGWHCNAQQVVRSREHVYMSHGSL